jgi:hypothetical protein
MLVTYCPKCGSSISVEIGDNSVVCNGCHTNFALDLTLSWKVVKSDDDEYLSEMSLAYLEELKHG